MFITNTQHSKTLHLEDATKNLKKQIAELKQQLEEKDKEIAEINKFISLFNCDDFNDFEIFFGACMRTPHEKETLIIDLQRKLHAQPKEIVEKIKDLSGDYFYENNQNDLLLTGTDFTKILDEILKEYEEKTNG